MEKMADTVNGLIEALGGRGTGDCGGRVLEEGRWKGSRWLSEREGQAQN